MWKRRTPALPTSPVEYPSGTAVRTSKGLYLIKEGKRYKFISERVMASWGFPRVVLTSEESLTKYPVSRAVMGFRDGSLIYNIKDAKIYVMENRLKRQIEDPDVLTRLGATMKDVVVVSDREVALHKDGAPCR